jgi:hypothetical protein
MKKWYINNVKNYLKDLENMKAILADCKEKYKEAGDKEIYRQYKTVKKYIEKTLREDIERQLYLAVEDDNKDISVSFSYYDPIERPNDLNVFIDMPGDIIYNRLINWDFLEEPILFNQVYHCVGSHCSANYLDTNDTQRGWFKINGEIVCEECEEDYILSQGSIKCIEPNCTQLATRIDNEDGGTFCNTHFIKLFKEYNRIIKLK